MPDIGTRGEMRSLTLLNISQQQGNAEIVELLHEQGAEE